MWAGSYQKNTNIFSKCQFTYLWECHQEAEDHGDKADDDQGEEVVAVAAAESPGGRGLVVLDTGALGEVTGRRGLTAASLTGREIHQAVRATDWSVRAVGGAGALGTAVPRGLGQANVGRGGAVQQEDEEAGDVEELDGNDQQEGSLHSQLQFLHDPAAQEGPEGPASHRQQPDDLS